MAMHRNLVASLTCYSAASAIKNLVLVPIDHKHQVHMVVVDTLRNALTQEAKKQERHPEYTRVL